MDAPRWTHFFRENNGGRRGESDIEYENSFSWNASFSRTMTSKTSPMANYENSEIITGPLHHTSHCHSREMQYLRPMVPHNKDTRVPPVSTQYDSLCKNKDRVTPQRIQVTKNGILNRELPPIPQQKSPTTESRPQQKQQKHRDKNRHPDRGSNKKKTSQQNTETSVVLSVSLRSKNSHKNSKHNGKTVHENSRHDSLNRKYVREDSTNSQKEFIDLPNRRVRRRRRKSSACVIPLIVLTVVILGGLFGALGFILLNSKKEDSKNSEKSRTEFDMVLAKTHMKILNKEFTEELKNNASEQYLTFTKTFTDQVNYLFLTSNYSNSYYGSEIVDLRQGSINSISDLLFKDSSDLRNPKTIESFIKQSSPSHTFEGNKAINLGEYVVDYNSIYVDIKQFKLYELPKRPQLIENDFEVDNEISIKPKTTSKSASVTTNQITRFTQTTSSMATERPLTRKVTSTTGMVTPDNKPGSTTTESSILLTKSESKTVRPTKATPQSVIISTIQTTTEIPLPIVSVSNLTINTTTQNASVVCSFNNLEFWEYLTVTHVSTDKTNSVIINVTSEGSLDFPSMQYSNRLFLDLRIGFSSATITLNFTVDCSDDGLYVCHAYADGQHYTGNGELRIREPPTKPSITVPIEVVENRPIEYPIICRANVGFPRGRLLWMIKPPNHQRFFSVPGTSSSSEGKCGNIVTNEFVLTPSMAGNGTTLKCHVSNDHYLTGNTSDENLSDNTVLRVVPASVCQGITKGTTIRHPYRCDKYINCTSEDDFRVFQCPEELCYDIKSGQCGQTGLSLTNTTAFLNEGVTSLTCRLQHVGRWSGLQIYRETSTGRSVLLVVKYSPKGPPIKIMPDTIKHRYFSVVNTKRYEVDVMLWIYKLNCNDNGQYKCRADIPFELPDAVGFVNLIVKPETPLLSAPTEIVDGRGLRENFTCKANVGYPGGNLYWEMRPAGRRNFTRNLPFIIEEKIEERNCSRQIFREFSLIPSPKFDGLELRCVVENENALEREQFLMTEYVINVIPADTCNTNTSGPLPHPSDCRQYIQCTNDYLNVQRCSQSLCFNPETLECDLPEPVDQTPSKICKKEIRVVKRRKRFFK